MSVITLRSDIAAQKIYRTVKLIGWKLYDISIANLVIKTGIKWEFVFV